MLTLPGRTLASTPPQHRRAAHTRQISADEAGFGSQIWPLLPQLGAIGRRVSLGIEQQASDAPSPASFAGLGSTHAPDICHRAEVNPDDIFQPSGLLLRPAVPGRRSQPCAWHSDISAISAACGGHNRSAC